MLTLSQTRLPQHHALADASRRDLASREHQASLVPAARRCGQFGALVRALSTRDNLCRAVAEMQSHMCLRVERAHERTLDLPRVRVPAARDIHIILALERMSRMMRTCPWLADSSHELAK